MFFMNENLVLDFMAAGTLSWKEKSCTVAPRGMDALTFRLRGSGSVFVGEKEYPLEENDFLFMPGGVGYRAEYTDTEIVYFYFLTAERFPEPEVFTPPSPAFFRTLCLDGASCWDLSVPGYKLRTASALMGILAEISRQATRSEAPVNPGAERAIRFLQESFRDPEVNISAACRHGGISEGYFRRIFRQRFGISPIAYLTSLRADLGRKLLAEGATVESAAAACGICDPKYFSRVLKKVYGCTPSRMKNNTD